MDRHDRGAPSPTDRAFDLVCAECSRPIRWSRRAATVVGELDYFVDEEEMEARDYHFHLPVR
jgi:hypothetical protein